MANIMIPSAQSSAPYEYGVPNVFLIGTARLNSDQATISLDYNATQNDRVSAKYFYQNAPVTRPFGFSETAGFPVTQHNGAQVFSLGNTISIGPRLNWEQRLGFVRMGSFSNYQQTVAWRQSRRLRRADNQPHPGCFARFADQQLRQL